MKRLDQFSKARITLTAWYTSILAIILISFSIGLYTVQMRDYNRVVIQRQFRTRTRIITPEEVNEIRNQAEELRDSLINHILEIDLSILVLGGLMSYFLAGKTLQPIALNMKKQKEFVSDASHELRTPLTALISGTEIALRKPRSTSDYKKALDQNLSVAKGMHNIVEELLNLSRIDSGTKIKKADVELAQTVKETITEYQPLAKEKNLILKADQIEETTVLGDRDKLKQLVVILLDNAIKYTHKGSITVSLKNKVLKVKDSGVGISASDRDKVFERLYRADKARSTPGAGLGLSIAQEIVKMHQADISVKSTPGKGSIFRVIF